MERRDNHDPSVSREDVADDWSLAVKHLPPELSESTLQRFFQSQGPVKKLKILHSGHLAFVNYETSGQAEKALRKLNGYKLVGRELVVEWAKESTHKLKSRAEREKMILAPNPALEYLYPPADPTILNNIYNAIAGVPKLYVQVCHLMNKMNLPPPFTTHVHPVLPGLQRVDPRKRNRIGGSRNDAYESEVESEEEEEEKEEPVAKRQATIIHHTTTQPKSTTAPIQMHVPDHVNTRKSEAQVVVTEMQVPAVEKESDDPKRREEEVPQPAIQLEETRRNFVTEEQMREGRMSQAEMDKLVFQDRPYHPGVPCSKLFIRSLPKEVTISQIEALFGRFFPSQQQMKESLQIKIMGGRMKGQAFVQFTDASTATQALEGTHGYVMDGKPILIVSLLCDNTH
ncbi:hypothetical protein PROFUN_15720 [Planoprotostelium fungivorum]|uniref:RRM domain-containing protein n=1 Tax=Planoprotostelium fungivorum TaxID=1890364 RepID=A0A2P6MUT9_9EUKA|nr:hypothetical protein PROFUN_15720 [Planoprotostelium fungivorum]